MTALILCVPADYDDGDSIRSLDAWLAKRGAPALELVRRGDDLVVLATELEPKHASALAAAVQRPGLWSEPKRARRIWMDSHLAVLSPRAREGWTDRGVMSRRVQVAHSSTK